MRILMTVPAHGHRIGGPARVAAELAEALERFGHAVRLVGDGEASTATGLGSVGRFSAGPLPRALGSQRLVPGADVVHVFGVRDPVGAYAALRARTTSVPYVIEPAGAYRLRPRGLRLSTAYDETFGYAIARDAGAFVVSSNREVGEVVAAGIARRRVHIRPPVVAQAATPAPDRGALRERLAIDAEAALVLVRAPINAHEGLDVFARALASLPDVVGMIAGPDERDGTRGHLERLRTELGLGERLRILADDPSGPDHAQALADADCLCLPTASDGFGIAAAEGACAGLPVVITRDAGVADVLDPAGCRLVPPGDVAAMSVALGEVLWSPSVRRAARDGATAVAEALDPDALAARQLAIYDTVR